MDRAGIAEGLLAFVMPRERAACIVGDLTEDARVHGRRGFWFDVVGIAFEKFFCAFGTARLRTLAQLSIGLGIWCTAYVAVRVAADLAGMQPLLRADASVTVRAGITLGAALVVAGLLTGFAFGRQRSAAGLSGAAPLVIFFATLALVLPLLGLVAGSVTWQAACCYLVGIPALYCAPVMAGSALAAAGAAGRAAGATGT
jgi:hypothetical protein